jgi:hypothetical protein
MESRSGGWGVRIWWSSGCLAEILKRMGLRSCIDAGGACGLWGAEGGCGIPAVRKWTLSPCIKGKFRDPVSDDKTTHCSLIGRYNPGMEPERLLSRFVAVVAGLVLFFVIGGELAFLWGKAAGDVGPLTFPVSMALGLAFSVLVVWKSNSFVQRGLSVLRAKSPEPFYSCFISGLAATVAVSAFMSVPVLLLGHTPP